MNNQQKSAGFAGFIVNFCSIFNPSISHRNCCQEIGCNSPGSRGHLEGSILQTLIQKDKSVPFPQQSLDAVTATAAEQEQGIAVRIKVKAVLNDIHQPIELLPHIGISSTDIDIFHMGDIS